MVSPSPVRRAAASYSSAYGPKYAIKPHLFGLTTRRVTIAGNTLAGFAVTGIFGALYFLGDVPRVRKDILEKVPIIGPYWHREIAPEDNPF